MRKECKIIQDLLPNYIDNVTNEETNKFILEHLQNCVECKKIYDSMREDFGVKPLEAKAEISYMKKFRRKLKILQNILIVIVIAFIIVIFRKVIILNDLIQKSHKIQNLNNYYVKSVVYQDETVKVLEGYSKDGTTLSTYDVYLCKDEASCTRYIFFNNQEEKVYIKDKEIITNDNEKMDLYIGVHGIGNDIYDFGEYLKYIFKATIRRANLDGNKCYLIKIDNTEIFVDEKTGMRIKFIDNNFNLTEDDHYDFGNVVSDNVKRPDLTAMK